MKIVDFRLTSIVPSVEAIPQYSVSKILIVWVAAAMPMAVLGWFVAPALVLDSDRPVLVRLAVLTAGLVWQFVLVVWLLSRETHTWRWAVIKDRLWLTAPRAPDVDDTRAGAGRDRNARLWWWLVPVIALTALFDLGLKGTVDRVWVSTFPSLAEPPGWSLNGALATPEARAQLVGAWGTYGLFLVNALFNTFLGEELLFRGVLLPRMAGVFGKSDWVANGLLFGLYHLHQPWGIAASIVHGVLLYALPTRYFRSAWFGIAAHSGQSVFFAFLMLGLILGLQ